MTIKPFIFAVAVSAVATGVYAGDDAATIALKKRTVTSQNYVDTNLATKQPILETKSGDYAVIYPNSTNSEENGAVGQREIVDSVSGTATGLITAGAVNTAVNTKQVKIDGSAALEGKIVTYTDTPGQLGSKAVFDSSTTYAGQGTALLEVQHAVNAITSGFNAHITCANEPDCTLWKINQMVDPFHQYDPTVTATFNF